MRVNGELTRGMQKHYTQAAKKATTRLRSVSKAALKNTAKRIIPGLTVYFALQAGNRGFAGEGRYEKGGMTAGLSRTNFLVRQGLP